MTPLQKKKPYGITQEKGSHTKILFLLLGGDMTKKGTSRKMEYRQKESWVSGYITRLIDRKYVDSYRKKGFHYNFYRLNLKILFEFARKEAQLPFTSIEKKKLINLMNHLEKYRKNLIWIRHNEGVGNIPGAFLWLFYEYFVNASSNRQLKSDLNLLAKIDVLLDSVMIEYNPKREILYDKLGTRLANIFNEFKQEELFYNKVDKYRKKIIKNRESVKNLKEEIDWIYNLKTNQI